MLNSVSKILLGHKLLQLGGRRRAVLQRITDQLEPRLLLAATPGTVDSFESGLPDHWSIPELNGEGRVSVRNLVAESLVEVELSSQFTTAGNENALVFDSSRASGDAVEDLSLAILTIDISGVSDALLTFHQLEGLRGDINHELPDQHELLTNGDGLAFSQDGTNWYAMQTIQGHNINRGGDGLWQLFEFDLIDNIERINSNFGANLNQQAELQIKFSQYDNDVFPRRGWAIDNVRIDVESPQFDSNVARGVVHRFSLQGEAKEDYYYRAGFFGNITPSTPILISTHGTSGDANYGHSRVWHRFAADPANGIDSLIVLAPAFVESTGPGRYNTPTRYATLSWNTVDDAAADLVLLRTVDVVAGAGLGDGDELLLWGFSAGGQFTGRFTAAHPDRVGAAVVGGPSSQIFADDSISFPYGTGHDPDLPSPAGVVLDSQNYANSRIMYFVGQDDDDPNHSQLGRGATIDSLQGIHRLQRAINQFEQISGVSKTSVSPDAEFELFVSEGDGHGGWDNEANVIYEFLTRQHPDGLAPVRIHSRIVTNPTSGLQQEWLPASQQFIVEGTEFFVEIWSESPTDEIAMAGKLDLFFDEESVRVIEFEHGLYSESPTGVVDNAAGRIRELGGSVPNGTERNGKYALFKRIRLIATLDIDSPQQLLLAPQRLNGGEFILQSGLSRRTDILPVPKTIIEQDDAADGVVQGVVFGDVNGDGIQGAEDLPIAGRSVSLLAQPTGSVSLQELTVEPDDSVGEGAYLSNFSANVTLSGVGSNAANAGIRVRTPGEDGSSTGIATFAMNESTGSLQSFFSENTRELRMDFQHPTYSVSIDVVAHPSTSSAFGTLEVYDHSDNLIGTATSARLSSGAFETLTVISESNDIAYAKSFGTNSIVRLDNLRFTSLFTTVTDENGFYRFQDVAPGDYSISTELFSGEGFSGGATPDDVLSIGGSGTFTADVAVNGIQLRIAPSEEPLEIPEGTSRSVSISLTAQPSTSQIFRLESGDPTQVTLSAQELSFTPENWDVAQQLTITAIDDKRLDGDVAVDVLITESNRPAGTLQILTLDNDLAELVVEESDGSSEVAEPDGADTVSVSLTSQPDSAVVIDISNSLPRDVAATPTTLVFDSENWNQSQTVSIAAIDDNFVEAASIAVLTFAVRSSESDSAFHQMQSVQVDVEIFDDEVAGFSVSESEGESIVNEDGDTDAVSVVLDARPTQDVLFDISPSDSSELSVEPSVLVFTSENWNVPQNFTLTGVDDQTVDGTITSNVRVSVNAAASQAEFRSLIPINISVATTDNDVPGFQLTETDGSTVVNELGQTDAVAVVLNSQPLSDVVIDVATSHRRLMTDRQTITFTPANWDQSQAVVLALEDDALVNGNTAEQLTFTVHPQLSDIAFSRVSPAQLTVLLEDDDAAGISVTETEGSTIVSEDRTSDSVLVTLTAQPLSSVSIDLVVANPGEVSPDTVRVAFTPADWNVPKAIRLTGVDDEFVDGAANVEIRFTVDANVSDDAFDDVSPISLTVQNSDNDLAGFDVSETSLAVSEDGTQASFDVVLDAAPLGDVVLQVRSTDTAEVTVFPTIFTFNSTNWNQPQAVTVSGVNEDAVDGDTSTNVTVRVVDLSSDQAFHGVSSITVLVSNADDDIAGLLVSRQNVSVTESGSQESVMVSLTGRPQSTVVLDLRSTDVGEVIVSPATVTFTPTNWMTPQPFTVSGIDDSIVDGNQETQINVSVNVQQSDPLFHNASSQSVSVTTINDDEWDPVDVDGDMDFDANDSFLIHLVRLSGTNAQVDQSKGSSQLDAAEIRARIDQLEVTADVDGDNDFDANDSFLVHLVKLSGTDIQIDQSKGGSLLSATEIRGRVASLAGGNTAQGNQSWRPVKSEANNVLLPKWSVDDVVIPEANENEIAVSELTIWNGYREWIDKI